MVVFLKLEMYLKRGKAGSGDSKLSLKRNTTKMVLLEKLLAKGKKGGKRID